jgi:hypothetical protein
MGTTTDRLTAALISCAVSALISGVGVFYLQSYIRARAEEGKAEKLRRRDERQRSDILNSQWRHAVGRVLFWLRDCADKGRDHANGYLPAAFDEFNAVEARQKEFEQQMLAEHNDENRS